MSAFDQIRQAYFGGSEMPLPLSPESRCRLMWVSLAPGVVLAAAVISMALILIFEDNALFGFIDGGDDSFLFRDAGFHGVPLFWRRLYAACEALQVLEPLALALLFAAGLQRWSRAEGSWMRVIGVSLAAVALASGAFVVGAYAVLSRSDVQDLDTFTWMKLARTFGYMAIGYFFLAYRATQPIRATTRRRRPRPA